MIATPHGKLRGHPLANVPNRGPIANRGGLLARPEPRATGRLPHARGSVGEISGTSVGTFVKGRLRGRSVVPSG